MIHSFIKLRQFLSLKYLSVIYRVLFLPVWSYGIIIWGGTVSYNIDILEKLNRKIMKAILNKSKRFSTDLLYKKLGYFNVRQQACFNILKH